jgi:hypothetical protein
MININITSHVLLYILVFFIVFYLILRAYFRIKMHFWHTQPVFHIYNLKYWINPPGFINREPPPLNKFVNLINNKLIQVPNEVMDSKDNSKDETDIIIKRICKFIRDYYIIHNSTTYKPSDQDIISYLQCLNHPSFINIYQEPKLLFSPINTDEQDIIGVITTRVLNVTVKYNKKINSFPVYYVDHLCVRPGYRKKGISPEMIQTFYYTMARTNSKVNAYMFKREGQLTAIVPLVYYDTYSFDITQLNSILNSKTNTNTNNDYILHASMNVIEIGIQQLNIVISFIKEQKHKFDCIILPDVSSVINLIKLGKIKIYGIISNNSLIAIYVFRNIELYYDNKKTIECIMILSTCKTNDILIGGFRMSLIKLSKINTCDILFIENTAHSNTIINYLLKNPIVTCNFKSPTAFFLYNYAAYSVKNTKSLLFY